MLKVFAQEGNSRDNSPNPMQPQRSVVSSRTTTMTQGMKPMKGWGKMHRIFGEVISSPPSGFFFQRSDSMGETAGRSIEDADGSNGRRRLGTGVERGTNSTPSHSSSFPRSSFREGEGFEKRRREVRWLRDNPVMRYSKELVEGEVEEWEYGLDMK